MSGKKNVSSGKPAPKAQAKQSAPKAQPQKQNNQNNKVMSAFVAQSERRAPRFEIRNGSKGPGSILVSGQDLIGPVNVPSGAVTLGQVLYNSPLGPSSGALSGTRLSQYGKLYERYLFKRFKVHWSPTVATGLPLGVVLTYDRDPSDETPPSSIQGLQSLLGHEGAVTGPIWSPMSLEAKLDAPSQAFYTNSKYDADERLAYQGQFYVAMSNAASGLGVGATLGLLWIEYEIEFFQPQLEGPVLYGDQRRQTAGSNVLTTDAWQTILSGLTAGSSVAAPYLLRLLSSGKTGFKVPPGNYEVIQRMLLAGAGIFGAIQAPQVTNVNGSSSAPTVTLLDDAVNVLASTNSMARYRVVITDPDGAEINGTSTAQQDYATNLVKILRLDTVPV